MNRNFRIITINGFRGMMLAAFIFLGLIAGFIISPAWVCMSIWNFIASHCAGLSSMNMYQGFLLWAVIALSFYALNHKHLLIGVGSYQGLSNEQIRNIIKKAKNGTEGIHQVIKNEMPRKNQEEQEFEQK